MTLLHYSHDYDSDYDPALPIIEVVIESTKTGLKTEPLTSLIDSGADGCIVPVRYLDAIDAEHVRKARMRGVAGVSYIVDLYVVLLHIGEIEVVARVAADKNGDELIIGRNVLNQFILTLNGLAGVTEIST